MSEMVYRVGSWIIFIGIALTFLFQGDNLAKAIRNNLDMLEIEHVLFSNDAIKLSQAERDLTLRGMKNQNNLKTTILWAYIQIARGELSSLVPLLERNGIANDERGRLMLIRLGREFLYELNIENFRKAWQNAGVWGTLPKDWLALRDIAKESLQEENWQDTLELLYIYKDWGADDVFVNRSIAIILFNEYSNSFGAIAEMEQVVALRPDSIWDLNFLGQLYLETEEWNEAQQNFKRVLELDAENENAVVGLSKAHHAKGQETQAATLLETYLERHPDNVMVLVTLGIYYKERGNLDKSIVLMEHALQQNNSPEYRAMGHNILANIALSKDDKDKAKWHTNQANMILESIDSETK